MNRRRAGILVWLSALKVGECLRLGQKSARLVVGGSGLIDARGFLKDCYPVIDYEDEDELLTETRQIESEESQKKGGAVATCQGGDEEEDVEIKLKEQVSGVTKCYMRARQVPGDGSCLFHALSAGLWLGINGTHHPMERKLLRCQSYFLRQTAVDVLQNNRDPMLYMGEGEKLPASQLLQLAAEQQSQTPEEYCAKVREPHAWGGGPEIVALANALRRPIHVYELVWAVPLGPWEEQTIPHREEGGARWCLRCIAEFGSPRFDRKHAPLHILSCDSRFPNLRPEHMLDQGNHFLMLFDCAPETARQIALDVGFGHKAAESLAAEAKRRHERRQADIIASKRKKNTDQTDRFVADLNVDTTFVQEERTTLATPVLKRIGGPILITIVFAYLLKPLYDLTFVRNKTNSLATFIVTRPLRLTRSLFSYTKRKITAFFSSSHSVDDDDIATLNDNFASRQFTDELLDSFPLDPDNPSLPPQPPDNDDSEIQPPALRRGPHPPPPTTTRNSYG